MVFFLEGQNSVETILVILKRIIELNRIVIHAFIFISRSSVFGTGSIDLIGFLINSTGNSRLTRLVILD